MEDVSRSDFCLLQAADGECNTVVINNWVSGKAVVTTDTARHRAQNHVIATATKIINGARFDFGHLKIELTLNSNLRHNDY